MRKERSHNHKIAERMTLSCEQTAGPAAGDKNCSRAYAQNYYQGAGQMPKETGTVLKMT